MLRTLACVILVLTLVSTMVGCRAVSPPAEEVPPAAPEAWQITEVVLEADISAVSSPEDVMTQTVERIKMRLDAWGVIEPIVERQGTNLIIVRLPGVEITDELIELITSRAQLDFRELKVDENGNPVLDNEGNWVFKDESAKAVGRDGKERELTGEYLKHARQDIDPYKGPVVVIEWDSEGGYLFEKITERNFHKPLAIFLDDKIISAPVVQSVIRSGTAGQIEGDFTMDEAELLAIWLNCGAFSVPLHVISR